MSNEEFIVVEIPHRSKPKTWLCESIRQFIVIAEQQENFKYYELPRFQDAVDVGLTYEDNFIRPAKDVLSKDDPVVVVACDKRTLYFKKGADDTPTEFEAAQDVLFYGLYRGLVLPIEDARQFADDNSSVYRGPQEVEARAAVKEELCRRGYVNAVANRVRAEAGENTDQETRHLKYLIQLTERHQIVWTRRERQPHKYYCNLPIPTLHLFNPSPNEFKLRIWDDMLNTRDVESPLLDDLWQAIQDAKSHRPLYLLGVAIAKVKENSHE